jgi:hypothetical protein
MILTNTTGMSHLKIILPLESSQNETSKLLDEDKIISQYVTFNISFTNNLSKGNFLNLSLCLQVSFTGLQRF